MSGYECSKCSRCYHIGSHLINHVQIAHGDPDFNYICTLEEVDGETLLNLSVRTIEQLLPAMKLRVKLLKLTEQLKGDTRESLPGPSNVARASNTAASVWSTEVVRNVWPQRYTLPKFPPPLLQGLGEKSGLLLQPQRNEAGTKLVAALADDILSKTPRS